MSARECMLIPNGTLPSCFLRILLDVGITFIVGVMYRSGQLNEAKWFLLSGVLV